MKLWNAIKRRSSLIWEGRDRFYDKTITFFYLPKIYYFFKFLVHRYDARQFSPRMMKDNFALLQRERGGVWVDVKMNGKIVALDSSFKKVLFCLKNICLLGALQSRLIKVINLTFLVASIEVYNPFDKTILKIYLERKLALIGRLIEKLKRINGASFDAREARYHLHLFHYYSLIQKHVIENIETAVSRQKIPSIVKEVTRALGKGIFPMLVTQGLSGAYWMRDSSREVVGLFKPFDEEINAPNNPLGPAYQGGLGQRRTRRGIRVGEAVHREVAAYLIDQFFGFGIVPKTYYATFSHPSFFHYGEDPYSFRRSHKTKIGSFQEVVVGFEPVLSLSSEELKKITLEEFQLLIVLDVIIGNCDRHANNILVNEGKIAAIDHGLSFPDTHETMRNWYWKAYDLGNKPIHPAIAKVIIEFPEKEVFALLKGKCLFSINVLERMRERVTLFRIALEKGLLPKDLSELMTRQNCMPLWGLKITLEAKAKKVLDGFNGG
ncbi:MAG: hypothetical protein KDK55_03690 [Chlamydiia bacterium]|nr:hypothetical protein [Chlamydiia bacterium]